MPKKNGWSFDIEANVEVQQDKLNRAAKILEAFYNKYQNRQMQVGTSDLIEATKQGIAVIRNLYEDGTQDATSWLNIRPEMKAQLEGMLSDAENVFDGIKVLFNDQSYVSGLTDILRGFDSQLSIIFADIGGKYEALKEEQNELFTSLRYDMGLSHEYDSSDIVERIELLERLRDVQNEMQYMNPSLTSDDLAGGLDSKALERRIAQHRAAYEEMVNYEVWTMEQLEQRRQILSDVDRVHWSDSYQDAYKEDKDYDGAIKELTEYINDRKALIGQLEANEDKLFNVDGIERYVAQVRYQIEAYETYLKEMQTLKDNNAVIPDDGIGNLTGIVTQLEEIKDTIIEIKNAFKPLTDAFASGDSMLTKMVTATVADLDVLEQKFKHVSDAIDVISQKQFSSTTTNVFNQKISGNPDEDIDLYIEKAKQLLNIIEQLNNIVQVNSRDGNVAKAMFSDATSYREQFIDGPTKNLFNPVELGKSIEGAQTVKEIQKVIGALNQYKSTIVSFFKYLQSVGGNVDLNVVEKAFASIDGIDEKIKLNRANQVKALGAAASQVQSQKSDIVDAAKADANDVDSDIKLGKIWTEVKTLREQIEKECNTIRSTIEATFDFSTIDPKIENIKTITDNIYQQFAELQTKINALDLKLQLPEVAVTPKSESDIVNDAADAMKNEGKAAEDAVPKKNAFIEANKKAADSAKATKESAEGAAEGIKEESKAAKQAVQNLKNVSTKIGDKSKSVKLKGLTQEDFEEYASQIATDKGLTMGQVSVSMGQNDNMRVATVQMLNEELAQSVTYTYQLMELEEGLAEAYLTGYRAVGNTNKALRIAAAAQKKADTDRLKAAKEQAKNNEWLIRQQSKLDTQERRYKHSKKSIDGSTPLMSTETSLEGVVGDADKTIDTLAKHIRDRIQSTIGGTLTDELRKQILDDIRILQNEIAVAQNNKYSATNMKASNVETNKEAYTEYLNAFEANAKKANVFDVMKQSISALRDELKLVSDSTGLDKFIDNLKVARNKLAAEKAKYAQEAKENQQNEKIYNDAIKAQEKLYNLKKQMVGLDPESAKGQETMRKLTEAQNEYNEALSKTNRQLLTIGQLQSIEDLEKLQKAELSTKHREYQSSVSAEQEAKDLKYVLSLYKQYTDAAKSLKKMQSDSTGAVHDDKMATAIDDVKRAKKTLLGLGIDVNNIAESELLTEKQILALLEEQTKYKREILNIENASSDKAATKGNKQNQNYGKTIFNRENRYFDTISAHEKKLSSDTKLSDNFVETLEKYKASFRELEALRAKFENNPDAFNNAELKAKFQSTALEVEGLRKEILSTFKEAQKFEQISASGSMLGSVEIDSEKFHDAKSAMIDFAASVTNGQFKLEGFNAAGTEMYGTLDKGAGAVEKVTVAIREGTDQLYAYKTGAHQASSSWQQLRSTLQNGVKQLARMYLSFHDIIRVVRQGLTYVKEIDLAMTELKKVTDETDETYKRFLKTASSTSSVIGSTVSDFTDATAAFARLGYSIDESAKMAETAIVYKNVADGLDTVEESTESIISTMKAYGIAADDTMSIIDRFNAVGKYIAQVI